MKRTLPSIKYLLLSFFLLSSVTLFADEVRVEPLVFWQQASQWSDTLTVDQLVEASLRASGLDEESLQKETLLFFRVLDHFSAYILPLRDTLTPKKLAEETLNWMHQEILTGRYIRIQTKMDVLLERGDYNCVSSALLYMVLTRSIGLDVRGEETVDHAFCTLNLSSLSIDVETTTTLGFDPGSRKEFGDSFSGSTGFAYVEPGDYSRRKAVSDKKMVSLILQNRIALLQQGAHHDEALGLTVDRWFFLPNEQHGKDMNDGIRNYSAQLNGRGMYSEGLEFLIPLSEELGLISQNQDLIDTLIANQIIHLTNRREPLEAQDFLDTWISRLSEKKVSELTNLIDQAQIDKIMSQETYSVALDWVRSYGEEGRITPSRRDELLTFLHQNEAIERVNQGGDQQGETLLGILSFFDELPLGERSLPGIVSHRRKYKENWAVYIHNQFVDHFNRGRYVEAEKIIRDALAFEGDNSLLLKDLGLLEKKMDS